MSRSLVAADDPEQNRPLEANQKDEKKDEQEVKVDPVKHELTITATRIPTEPFKVPQSVQILNKREIAQTLANGVSDLLSQVPGLDIVGVGANQSRPAIRSFRGQRILMLDNGIRLNNSRRQQDFGEIPASVEMDGLSQVEVVRGPSSVLYGSDAIGGVINMISENSGLGEGDDFSIGGGVNYRYLSAGESHKGSARILGNLGRLSFRFLGGFLKSGDYTSPKGSFGDITLAEPVKVEGSGVEDRNLSFALAWRFSLGHSLEVGYRTYRAEKAGFGFVDPLAYGVTGSRIKIDYPLQEVSLWRVDYENSQLKTFLADRLSFTLYRSDNNRELHMNVWIPINSRGASIEIDRMGNADVGTWGGRLEMRKQLFSSHTLTYGGDFFVDESIGISETLTTLRGMGPVHASLDRTPEMPDAQFRSYGFFAQDEFDPWRNGTLIAGFRYQWVSAESHKTALLDRLAPATFSRGTLVGALNYLHQISRRVNLFASLARGFRSPNLIEQFFEGVTPDGGAYQSRNSDLKSETSLNLELGARYKGSRVDLEGGVFWNTLYDGIRTVATGRFVGRFPDYTNVNIDRIGVSGYELLGRWQALDGLFLEADFTKLNGRNLSNPEIPYTEHYDAKFNLGCRYADPKGLFWTAYRMRLQGDQKELELVDNPIGPYIPGFTLHSVGAGLNLFAKTKTPIRLVLWVRNLTDVLYCESANATFFRPGEGRRVVMSVSADF